jgi:multicomponent Na+:H+ antiporter subunit C
MTVEIFFALTGAGIFCIGLSGLLMQQHLLRKILAVNVMAAGVSLTLVAGAARAPGLAPDPVPLALVITGIVVLVSATAFALSLFSRLYAETGQSTLDQEDIH